MMAAFTGPFRRLKRPFRLRNVCTEKKIKKLVIRVKSSDLVPSLNGKYEAWHWIRDAPDLQVIHAPLLGHLGDPSDICWAPCLAGFTYNNQRNAQRPVTAYSIFV